MLAGHVAAFAHLHGRPPPPTDLKFKLFLVEAKRFIPIEKCDAEWPCLSARGMYDFKLRCTLDDMKHIKTRWQRPSMKVSGGRCTGSLRPEAVAADQLRYIPAPVGLRARRARRFGLSNFGKGGSRTPLRGVCDGSG